MTKKLCEDEMPIKLRVADGTIVKERVKRDEYLQATLYYLEEYGLIDDKAIPMPDITPSNFETGLIFLRFLEKQTFTEELKESMKDKI